MRRQADRRPLWWLLIVLCVVGYTAHPVIVPLAGPLSATAAIHAAEPIAAADSEPVHDTMDHRWQHIDDHAPARHSPPGPAGIAAVHTHTVETRPADGGSAPTARTPHTTQRAQLQVWLH
jgi:hypothetical protein